MDATSAALIGAGVGAAAGIVGGVGSSLLTGYLQRSTAREARREDRRAVAYVEVAEWLYRLKEVISEHTGFEASEPAEPLDWAQPRKAKAKLIFGSRDVNRAFDTVPLALYPLLSAVQKADGTFLSRAELEGQRDQLVPLLTTLATAIDSVIDKMQAELR